MTTAERHRELLLAMCDSSKIAANDIIGHCDVLLEQADGPLTEDQVFYVNTIRNSTQRLLSLLTHLDQANELGTYLAANSETSLLRGLLQDLRNALGIMRVCVTEISGQLNDRQQTSVRGIQQLCQALEAAFIDYQMKAVEEGGDRP